MELLKELLELPDRLVQEAAEQIAKDGPVELKDVVANFPTKYEKVIKVLWGTARLTYKGQQFFTGKESSMDDVSGNLGPVYMGAMRAAEAAMKRLTIPVEFTGEDGDEVSLECKIDDSQECYLGYNPKEDKLYIGYDCWLAEDEYNDWADKFDDSDPKIDKMLNKAWKEFKDKNFQGEIFALSTSDGKKFTAEEDDSICGPGGFYKTCYKQVKRSKKLIDLRLD